MNISRHFNLDLNCGTQGAECRVGIQQQELHLEMRFHVLANPDYFLLLFSCPWQCRNLGLSRAGGEDLGEVPAQFDDCSRHQAELTQHRLAGMEMFSDLVSSWSSLHGCMYILTRNTYLSPWYFFTKIQNFLITATKMAKLGLQLGKFC